MRGGRGGETLPSVNEELLSLLLPPDKISFLIGDNEPVSANGKPPGLSVNVMRT